MDSEERLSRPTIALHWLVAAGVLGLIGLGLYMVNAQAFPLYHLHKSIGLLLFSLILLRILWRAKNGWPKPVRPLKPLEAAAAKGAHWLLIGCTVAMPLSGMLYSAASGNGFGVFAFEIFPANSHKDASHMAIPFDAGLARIGQTLHDVLGYVLVVLIAAHVAAALKHHLIDRDRTLVRMLGAK